MTSAELIGMVSVADRKQWGQTDGNLTDLPDTVTIIRFEAVAAAMRTMDDFLVLLSNS